MKHGMLLILVFSLLGCQDILDPDSSDNETQPSDSWIKHEGFQGLDSTTYMARVTGDKLTVQRPYGISWIYADNTRDHWRNSYFRSDNVIGNIIGDTYMAIPQKDMTGFEYHTHEFMLSGDRDRANNVRTENFFTREEWTSKATFPGAIRAAASRYAGPSPAGTFNEDGLLGTVVYTPNRICHAVIIKPVIESGYDDYPYEIYSFQTVASPCYTHNAHYATNGHDFFIGLENTVLRYSQEEGFQKIWDDRVTNLFYLSTGQLFLQKQHDVYISYDEGNSWDLFWKNSPDYRLNFFEANSSLYFFKGKQIVKVGLDNEKGQLFELDNSGLDKMDSIISSVTEFNGSIYITTMGDGVFYKNLTLLDDRVRIATE